MKTPSEQYNTPIIGKIKSQLKMTLNNQLLESNDEFEVIGIKEHYGKKIYICNQWHKPGVPQLVSEDQVLEFIKY